MWTILILDVGSWETMLFCLLIIAILFVLLINDNLERNEDIAFLINGFSDERFMERFAEGGTASISPLIDEAGKVFRMENFSYLA